ncbi:MAG: class II aldolase/adducin family protein [Pseudomonadota bacterium]|nr:class II aldolase/adducin family protein [Pseudomonadota bacterium]
MAKKKNLALAYQICAMLELDDHTYTHLTCKADAETFFIQQFGLKFQEVNEHNLIKVSNSGELIEGTEKIINPTGYQIHGIVYKYRPDIQAIFHLHTPHMVAVSNLKDGLLPLSQWSLHFYNNIAYHSYDSLITENDQGKKLVADLGHKNIMLMRNHGALITGKTIHEAMFYTHHLELACKTQCLTLAMQKETIAPNKDTCEKSVKTLLNFEKDLGIRDWHAWVRQLKKETEI